MGEFGISQPVLRCQNDKLLHGHGIRHIDMPATSERVWSEIRRH